MLVHLNVNYYYAFMLPKYILDVFKCFCQSVPVPQSSCEMDIWQPAKIEKAKRLD